MKNKKRIVVGYLFIIIGIFLPLIGFTNLSKNIINNEREYKKFIEISKQDDLRNKIESYNKEKGKKQTIIDPFSTEEYDANYLNLKNKDEIFAYLKIEKIDLLEPIFLGASNKHMAKGLGHVEGTDLPTKNKGTRSVIAGHRGYYEAIMFLNLDELKEGDRVSLERGDTKLEYFVKSKEVIRPYEIEKLNPEDGKTMLTLLTCNPLVPPRPERLLVNCELINEDDREILGENKESRENEKVLSKVKIQNRLIIIITIILLLFLFKNIIILFKFLKN